MPSCCLPFKLSPPDGNLMTIHPPRGCLCLICMSSQSRNFFGGVSQGCFSPLLVCQLDSCLASPADHTFSRPRCGSVPRPQQKHVGRSLRRRQLTRHGACAGATREGDAPSVPKYHRTSASAVVLPPVRTARTNAQRGATSARARACSRPTESPGRGVRSAKSLSTPLACVSSTP